MIIKTNISRAKEDFYKLCKNNGLKITPQRLAVFNELISTDRHPSIEGIYNEIKKTQPNISFDTIYRTVNSFVEAGIICQVESSQGIRRFDANLEDHHHFTCTICGRIIDFTNIEFSNIEIPDDFKTGFKITAKKVILEGICDKCSKRLNKQKKTK